jgi:hypothetical protein
MNTTKVSPQGTDRKTAVIVGVLFILGTVPAVLSLPLMSNTVNAPDHLTAISTNAGQMIIFTSIKFFMGIACAGIGLALYPILKKYNEGLAIGSAGFRVIEGMASVVGALLYVVLLALSQEFVKAGAPASSYFQTADVVVNAGIGWLRDSAMLLTFGIGALMYYIVFYQYRRSSMANRLGSRWNHIDHHQRSVGDVPSSSSCYDNRDCPQSTDPPAGAGLGCLADRERVQSVGSRFRGCKNFYERAFERGIDLHDRV